jgi:DNA-binding transcriptional MerR regulator
MIIEQPRELTLEELSSEAVRLLEEHGLIDAQQDRRVSAVPDVRTIRYYTTLGLLDRPKMVGRQAQYGRRHLLQLLAIKVLQQRSLPLSEIQARLYGRSDTELETILLTMSEKRSGKQEEFHPVCWREVVIEPGLKIMVEEKWSSGLDQATLEQRIRAAIVALKASEGANGE